jgi:hypothetical protein
MANRITVSIKASPVIAEENFSGEICKVCEDAIYGIGFRVTMAVSVNNNDLPSFKDTNIILCVACKNTVEW